VLREEFVSPLGIELTALAAALSLPVSRIKGICRETESIDADVALRLARHFRTTPEFWMNLQVRYELDRARAASGAEIERLVPVRA
jgi:addiction module HigA family antidote